jgi:hypothetical protein
MKIISVVDCPIIRNFTSVRKYKIQVNNEIVYALVGNENPQAPLTYNEEHDVFMMSYVWTYHKHTGYIYCRKSYLHRCIAAILELEGLDNKALSVDHINWYKNDNRVVNLRMATQSEQNSNRATRRDKLPPHESLVAAGVEELAKYVRWDNTERKFIIEKHPVLLEQVVQGVRMKPTMSGTKKQNLSILEKYQDILEKLQYLDSLHTDEVYKSFIEQRSQLKTEYEAIIQCISQYIGTV